MPIRQMPAVATIRADLAIPWNHGDYWNRYRGSRLSRDSFPRLALLRRKVVSVYPTSRPEYLGISHKHTLFNSLSTLVRSNAMFKNAATIVAVLNPFLAIEVILR